MRDMYWGCLLIFIPQNMNRADLNLVLYNPRKADLRKEKKWFKFTFSMDSFNHQ